MIAKTFLILTFCTLCLAIGTKLHRRPNKIPFAQAGQGLEDSGKPLFLTPLIHKGYLSYARNLSRVGAAASANLTSYSGYLTVNEANGSNMFFWYFPATDVDSKDAPLLLWLQGGPGAADMFGLFVEVGPIMVTSDFKIIQRKYHWAKKYNLLFIDSPVGTGFSFTKSEKGYAKNEHDIARDLYEAMQQFLSLFPNLRKNDFYITGESYAGKYIPGLGLMIHEANKYTGSSSKINLKGVAIGDGWTDPINQMYYSDLLYQIGLVDENQRDQFAANEKLAREHISNKNYLAAYHLIDHTINGDLMKYPTMFTNFTGLTDIMNFMVTSIAPDMNYFHKVLSRPEVRKAIHVGSEHYNDGSKVESFLLADQMESVKDWLAVVMDNYRVLLYNGQLDIIVAPVLTERFLRLLEWKNLEEYKKAPRHIYKLSPNDTEVAGYYRQVGDFYQLILRNVGHMVPYDNPKVAYDMISRFVDGKGFK